jgi:hypothetical protein
MNEFIEARLHTLGAIIATIAIEKFALNSLTKETSLTYTPMGLQKSMTIKGQTDVHFPGLEFPLFPLDKAKWFPSAFAMSCSRGSELLGRLMPQIGVVKSKKL